MDNVFIRKTLAQTPRTFNIHTTLGKGKNITKGDIGLEIEVEGRKLPKEENTPSPWKYVHDGSLRGEDNAEYVLQKPLPFDAVDPSLAKLWDVFAKNGSRIDESIRTSVHVHLNVQHFMLNRLTSFMSLYFVFEEILTQWCGDHRVGNLFCLRAKDAPAVISQIRRFIRADMQAPLRDHHHYAAMNANAIHKFGSLEFRALRGVKDPKIISNWVSILRRLYDLSLEFPDPRAICDQFSSGGPTAFFDGMLGEYGPLVREGCSFTDEAIRDSLYEGIRYAQDLCFSRDWSKFVAMDLKPDPFGRDPRKVAARINADASEGLSHALAGLYNENMGHEGEFAMPDFDEHEEEDYDSEDYLAQLQADLDQAQAQQAAADAAHVNELPPPLPDWL